MPQLTATNISVLNNYAALGQRERYWSYLAALGDKYAARALEVVRNDSSFGQLANDHAAAAVPSGRQAEFTELRWNQFGVELMRADLIARKALFDNGIGDFGLTLPLKTIRDYHLNEFGKANLPPTAWTLESILGGMIDSGNPSQLAFAKTYWDIAISGPAGYALAAAWAPGAAVVSGGLLNSLTASAENVYLSLSVDGRNAARNPNFIRGWEFDSASGEWTKATGPLGGGIIIVQPSDAEKILLNTDRQYRIDRLNDPTRFQRDPLDTLTPVNARSLASLDPGQLLNPSADSLAIALGNAASGDFFSAQASLDSGVAGSVPTAVYDSIRAELAGKDLSSADTYKIGSITYVDFLDGDRLAIDQFGRISTVKTLSSAQGVVQTFTTDFDQSTIISTNILGGQSTQIKLDPVGNKLSEIIATSPNSLVSIEYSTLGIATKRSELVVDSDGTSHFTVTDGVGTVLRTTDLQRFDDGSEISTTRIPGGQSETIAANADGTLFSREVTISVGNNTEQIDQFLYVDGSPVLQSRRIVETLYDENGQSRIETVTTYVDGVPSTVRNSYGTDGSLLQSVALAPPSVANLTERQAITVLNDVAGLIGAVQSGRPLPILQSGLHVVNDLVNPAGRTMAFPGLNLTTGVVDGLASLYNLSNALQHGDTLTQISATLNTLNFVNSSLPALLGSNTVLSSSLNTFLNGSGTVFNAAADGLIASGNFNGLAAGGTPGVLPVVGLVLSIRAGDPVGIATGLVGLMNPVLLSTPPVGWIVAGVSILRALSSQGSHELNIGIDKFAMVGQTGTLAATTLNAGSMGNSLLTATKYIALCAEHTNTKGLPTSW